MSEAGRPVKTTCPYCGTGCGVDVLVRGDATEVSGDATHPTNAGKLCVKGAALGETLVPEGRALHPMLREPAGGRELQRVSWDTALDVVAREFRRIIREDGPQAEQYDWFCDMHRAALAISTIGKVRQVVDGEKLVSEFEVQAGAVPFVSDFVPLAYSGGLPLAITGAIVSTASIG